MPNTTKPKGMRKTWCVLIIVIPDEGVHLRIFDEKIKAKKMGAIARVVQKRKKEGNFCSKIHFEPSCYSLNYTSPYPEFRIGSEGRYS